MNEFTKNVLDNVRRIPKGKVVSYGQVALMSDYPRAARQVGWILSSHGEKSDIPWWRVIIGEGRISIKNPRHAASEQKERLESEGIEVNDRFELISPEKHWWTVGESNS